MTDTGHSEQRYNDLAGKVLRGQIDQLYQQTPRALAGASVVVLGLCVVQWQVVAHAGLLGWALATLIINLLRWGTANSYLHKQALITDAELYSWAHRHAFGAALAGAAWAFPLLFLWPAHSPVHQLIWCMGIMPLSAACIVTYYAYKPSYLAYLLLTALPVAGRLAGEGSYALVVLGVMACYFIFILTKAAEMVHATNRAMLESRFNNEALNQKLHAEIAQHKLLQRQLAERNEQLERALGNVKQLSGLLPICGSCKKIRNDQGYWEQVEAFIRERSNAQFSHGICPECARSQFPELFI